MTARSLGFGDLAARRAAKASLDGYQGRANAAPLRAWLAAP